MGEVQQGHWFSVRSLWDVTGFPLFVQVYECVVVISGCLQSVCVSGCLCFCHFLLSLSTNAFSGMKNSWLKTCALLLDSQIFFGFAMSPREKHRNKETTETRTFHLSQSLSRSACLAYCLTSAHGHSWSL